MCASQTKMFAYPENRAAYTIQPVSALKGKNTVVNTKSDTKSPTDPNQSTRVQNISRTPATGSIVARALSVVTGKFWPTCDELITRNAFAEAQDETIISKRSVTLKKQRGQDFGAELCFQNGHLYVVWVDKFERRGDGKTEKYTAAFKGGLGFGDEITSINSMGVSAFRDGLASYYDALDIPEDIILEVIDKTAFANHVMDTIPLKQSTTSFLGLTFSQSGTITRVDPDGLAHKAGLTVGRKIIRIDDEHVINIHPRQIVNCLFKSITSSKGPQISIITGPAIIVNVLSLATEKMLKQRDLQCQLNHALDSDFDVTVATLRSMVSRYENHFSHKSTIDRCVTNL
eukprot:CFRG6490T1